MHPPAGSLTAGLVGGDLVGRGSASGGDVLHQPVPSRVTGNTEVGRTEAGYFRVADQPGVIVVARIEMPSMPLLQLRVA